MLDLSRMSSVRVDPATRTARVEPGARLSDLDKETQAFGLATPTGINSTTGVAGGWLPREPKNATLPKLKAPPSSPTIR